MWADHDVHAHTTGTKRLQHPLVGDPPSATSSWPSRTTRAGSCHIHPEPASPTAEALYILDGWSGATPTGRPLPDQTPNGTG
ncbi:MmyB family transcriptional regulator [Streptomyces sp. 900116325]